MREILVVKPSSFGDIVHGLQVIASLKSQLGDCRITWIVRDIFEPLVAACKTVDAHLVYHRKGGFLRFRELLRAIRKNEFDCVIDLQGLARSGVMTFFARAPEKFGRSDARECAGLSYSRKFPLPTNGKVHAVDILLECLPLLGAEAKLCCPVEFEDISPRNFNSQSLQSQPLVIFPESRRPEKIWGQFDALTEALLENSSSNIPIIWAGNTPRKTPSSWNKQKFTNLLGKTDLDELITIVKHAGLVLANDSGPMHLAAAMGKPVLALFGPTPPERYGPYPLSRPTNKVLRAPDGNLQKLKVETVLNQIKAMQKSSTDRQTKD